MTACRSSDGSRRESGVSRHPIGAGLGTPHACNRLISLNHRVTPFRLCPLMRTSRAFRYFRPISTYVLGPRVIRGLAGAGLLTMVVLVAVYLRRAVQRHVPRPAPGSAGKGDEGREHQEYRRAYTEHPGVNSGGASSIDFATLGLRHPFTRQDVHRAFRAKSLRAHPDHGGDPDFFRLLVSARDRALADADDEEPTLGASPS